MELSVEHKCHGYNFHTDGKMGKWVLKNNVEELQRYMNINIFISDASVIISGLHPAWRGANVYFVPHSTVVLLTSVGKGAGRKSI